MVMMSDVITRFHAPLRLKDDVGGNKKDDVDNSEVHNATPQEYRPVLMEVPPASSNFANVLLASGIIDELDAPLPKDIGNLLMFHGFFFR